MPSTASYALLDLRLAGGEHVVLVAAIDAALSDIPGRSTVTNAWWMTSLAELRELLDTAHAAAH